MYTEIIKIIEAGLSLDRKRVRGYAELLAANLERKGESKFAERLRSVLAQTGTCAVASLDSLGAKPMDSESKLDIIDLTYPSLATIGRKLVFSPRIMEEIDAFVKGYGRRDELALAGAEAFNTLLLYGPPGCGKTSLAQLIAARTGLPLVTARLDALVSSLLGSTAKNLRKIFDYASRMPCVLFLDEFDAIAKQRDDRNELGELKRVVNGLLQEMDALPSECILIAATNHEGLLDKAVWRRFAKVLRLELPDGDSVERLLHLYLDGKSEGVFGNVKTFSRLKKALEGRSHSDVRTVALNAIRAAVLSGRSAANLADLTREACQLQLHAMPNDETYIEFLKRCGFTHRQMNSEFGLPLRKIRGGGGTSAKS